jgi:hypothetical protein
MWNRKNMKKIFYFIKIWLVQLVSLPFNIYIYLNNLLYDFVEDVIRRKGATRVNRCSFEILFAYPMIAFNTWYFYADADAGVSTLTSWILCLQILSLVQLMLSDDIDDKDDK